MRTLQLPVQGLQSRVRALQLPVRCLQSRVRVLQLSVQGLQSRVRVLQLPVRDHAQAFVFIARIIVIRAQAIKLNALRIVLIV